MLHRFSSGRRGSITCCTKTMGSQRTSYIPFFTLEKETIQIPTSIRKTLQTKFAAAKRKKNNNNERRIGTRSHRESWCATAMHPGGDVNQSHSCLSGSRHRCSDDSARLGLRKERQRSINCSVRKDDRASPRINTGCSRPSLHSVIIRNRKLSCGLVAFLRWNGRYPIVKKNRTLRCDKTSFQGHEVPLRPPQGKGEPRNAMQPGEGSRAFRNPMADAILKRDKFNL